MARRSPLLPPGLFLWAELSTEHLLAAARSADQSGYSELWYTDVRFDRDCYVDLGLVAMQTEHLLLGPGVSDPFTRHPAMIATAAATLDHISRGRVQIGLGSGATGLRELHIKRERPLRALREGVEIIRALLGARPFDYDGELFAVTQARLGFAPFRERIPVFIATSSPQTLRLCGRLADGVLLANLAEPAAVEEAIRQVRAGESQAGRAAGAAEVHLRLETFLDDDEAECLRVGRRHLAWRLIETHPNWGWAERLGLEAGDELRRAAATNDLLGLGRLLPPEVVHAAMLVGSVPAVVERLRRIVDSDLRKVVIRPLSSPRQGVMTTLDRFIHEVWPSVATEHRGDVSGEEAQRDGMRARE